MTIFEHFLSQSKTIFLFLCEKTAAGFFDVIVESEAASVGGGEIKLIRQLRPKHRKEKKHFSLEAISLYGTRYFITTQVLINTNKQTAPTQLLESKLILEIGFTKHKFEPVICGIQTLRR